VSDVPGAVGEQGDLVSRLRAVIGAKDEQIGTLQAALDASLERERRLELRLAEVERRLSMDSDDSGTPSSKERIGAKEARRVGCQNCAVSLTCSDDQRQQ
jgi:regulator of replication initiation timing